MSRICPQCGNLNGDETKFCISCGKSLEGPSGIPQTGAPLQGSQPDPKRRNMMIAGAGIAVVVILAVLLLVTHNGFSGFLSSVSPPVTTPLLTLPVTPALPPSPPSPEPTPVPTVVAVLTTTVPDTPVPGPASQKPVVCPSDRRACGANCTDLMTDVNNCGACGMSCTGSLSCLQGVCRAQCSFGQTQCFDGCFNLSFDTHNCGTCGNNCPVGLVCNTSICTPPIKTTVPTYAG
jgi:hypothetical protein